MYLSKDGLLRKTIFSEQQLHKGNEGDKEMTKEYQIVGVCRDHDRTEYTLQKNGDFEYGRANDNPMVFENRESALKELPSVGKDPDFSEIVVREISCF